MFIFFGERIKRDVRCEKGFYYIELRYIEQQIISNMHIYYLSRNEED